MPRPRQRRGADAKKEEKRLKREKQEQEQRAKEAQDKRARYTKTKLSLDELPSSSRPGARGDGGDEEDGDEDADAIPEVDPDTKAYFIALQDQIQEMEEIGHGQSSYSIHSPPKDNDDEDEEERAEAEDERPLLLRSALEALNGHELSLAADADTSVILERLLFAMDDFAKRVLVDRITGNFERLAKDRMGSHVLQTLLGLAGEVVDRETRGNIAPSPSSSNSTLPSMTSLLLSLLSELLPSLPMLIYDPFASHTLRILLFIFSGQSSSATTTSASAARSKKSQKWRKGKGGFKSFLGGNGGDIADEQVNTDKTKLAIPASFDAALIKIWESLNRVDDGGPWGEGIRRAAMNAVAGPAVRIMIDIESKSTDGWKRGGWADRILCGLVGHFEQDDALAKDEGADLREEYLAGLLRSPTSSPTFETLLLLSPPTIFSKVWTDFFHTKLHRLAGNSVANYVVAVGITRLNDNQLKETIEEVKKVGTERRGEWIDNARTGVLRNLLERASELGVAEGEISAVLLDTFQMNEKADQKDLITCVLSLNRLDHYKKLPSHVTAQPQTQGSILLQSWLKLRSPHQQVVLDAIHSLGIEGILALSRDATSSRILDSLLSSPSSPPREKRKFLLSLLRHYHTLADDRIGSRIAERCWSTADVYLKDKIAESLWEYDRGESLQRSSYGHFFARKVELPLFGRKREDWKRKMAGTLAPAPAPGQKKVVPPQAGGVEEKKKRERPVDEVDEIFGMVKGGGGKKVKAITEDATLRQIVEQHQGTEDVIGAL